MTRKLTFGLFVALLAMGMQSCGDGPRPANKNGHDLWLGDITVSVNAPYKELLSQYDKEIGDEGFRIKRNEKGQAVIYANTEAGLMYGTYHLKRLGDCGELSKMNDEIVEVP